VLHLKEIEMGKRKTRPAKQTLYWVIEGFDSTKKIYSTRVNSTFISRRQIESLLMALTAKAGLTFDEIVGAYMIKHTKLSNVHLAVQKDVQHHTLMCGSNPLFAARLVKA
jgi:hypothetical protein